MKFIYLYIFRGHEATCTIEADSREEADERYIAMKSAEFEGTVYDEVYVPDEDMVYYTQRVVH